MRRFAPMVVILVCTLASEATARSYKGSEFPDFSAKDAITGKQFSLSDLRGKVVLVDFWATWCGPCVAELPNVSRVYGQYHEKGFEIVSVSLDSDRARFESFARSKRMTWHHVMEGRGWKTRLAGKYGINSIPSMFVLDPDGVCIAENVRGRQLDAVIQRGIEMVKSADAPPQPEKPVREQRRPTRPPGPPQAPPAKPVELAAARAQLAAVADPLEQFERRLDTLDASIDDLRKQLPAPRNPAAAGKQVVLVLDGLADARHTAFLMGLLDGRAAPAVPANPLEADPDDPRSWVQVGEILQAAKRSIGDIRAAVAEITGQLSGIKADIRDLERNLSRGRAAEGDVADIEGRIAAVSRDLDDPWAGQIETARRIVAECCLPFDEAQAQLDGLDNRIGAVRTMLDAAPSETESLRALRGAFASVCADLESISTLINPDGQAVTSLPGDPFEGRRLKDRRVLSAMATQVNLAGEAVAALRTQIVQRRERFDGLIERVVALQQELADRLDAGDSADELRERFTEIAREVLALNDAVAGPTER